MAKTRQSLPLLKKSRRLLKKPWSLRLQTVRMRQWTVAAITKKNSPKKNKMKTKIQRRKQMPHQPLTKKKRLPMPSKSQWDQKLRSRLAHSTPRAMLKREHPMLKSATPKICVQVRRQAVTSWLTCLWQTKTKYLPWTTKCSKVSATPKASTLWGARKKLWDLKLTE